MDPWQAFKNPTINNVLIIPSVQGKHRTIQNRAYYGLGFAYEGRITYVMNGVRTVSDATCAILFPMGATYRLLREESGRFPLISFSADSCDIREFIRISLRHPETYLKEFEALRAAWLNGSNPAKVLSLFYGILARLSEEQSGSAHKGLLTPAMDYLSAHLYDPELTNDVLAKKANISEVYFRKVFKDVYGISPRQYIIEARIRHAKQLLGEQSASVTAVAEACGFSGVYHFCRTFKQVTGYTPREYEKKFLDEHK